MVPFIFYVFVDVLSKAIVLYYSENDAMHFLYHNCSFKSISSAYNFFSRVLLTIFDICIAIIVCFAIHFTFVMLT